MGLAGGEEVTLKVQESDAQVTLKAASGAEAVWHGEIAWADSGPPSRTANRLEKARPTARARRQVRRRQWQRSSRRARITRSMLPPQPLELRTNWSLLAASTSTRPAALTSHRHRQC